MSHSDPGYQCYAELAKARAEGTDFTVSISRRPNSSIAVIAPHGGGIEAGTSEVARGVAGTDLNLYLFEGIRPSGNFRALHLTSHRFDERRCLALLADCDHVVAVHGCRGDAQEALIGGLDQVLKGLLADALRSAGIDARLGEHRFQAVNPRNICNRGRRGVGVQVELTSALRLQRRPDAIIAAMRSVLLTL